MTRWKLFPFGEEAIAASQTDLKLCFTGHERDVFSTSGPDDDLDYMHARFRSPLTGRFLSVDPVEGDARIPQNWNRYSYVFGNPLKLLDPSGSTARKAHNKKDEPQDDPGEDKPKGSLIRQMLDEFLAGLGVAWPFNSRAPLPPRQTPPTTAEAAANQLLQASHKAGQVAHVLSQGKSVVEASVSGKPFEGISGTTGLALVGGNDLYGFVGLGKSWGLPIPVTGTLAIGWVCGYDNPGDYGYEFTSASAYGFVGASIAGDPLFGNKASSSSVVFTNDVGVSSYESYYLQLWYFGDE